MSFPGPCRGKEQLLRRGCLLGLAAFALFACAPEVVRRSATLVPMAGASDTIEMLEDTPIAVGPGYRRVIGRGSVWTRVGRIEEGDVYKPVGGVFTVEGAQIHEAYLVLDAGARVVGFYLPVEGAFSTAPGGPDTKLSVRRKDR